MSGRCNYSPIDVYSVYQSSICSGLSDGRLWSASLHRYSASWLPEVGDWNQSSDGSHELFKPGWFTAPKHTKTMKRFAWSHHGNWRTLNFDGTLNETAYWLTGMILLTVNTCGTLLTTSVRAFCRDEVFDAGWAPDALSARVGVAKLGWWRKCDEVGWEAENGDVSVTLSKVVQSYPSESGLSGRSGLGRLRLVFIWWFQYVSINSSVTTKMYLIK